MIRKATFLVSNSDITKCPKPDRAEIAFIGRSNVGKSSLINMLTGVKELAKTSQKPGKTQLINHFTIDDRWYLVDLPGYGFAKVSKDKKVKWEKMISEYLTSRPNLCGVFVLIDSRLEPQTIDLEFLNWCGEEDVPFVVAFTKADKQSKTQTDRNVKAFLNKLVEIFGDTPDYFVTSAEKEAVVKYLAELVAEFESQR
jgi:GTP-binding protein